MAITVGDCIQMRQAAVDTRPSARQGRGDDGAPLVVFCSGAGDGRLLNITPFQTNSQQSVIEEFL